MLIRVTGGSEGIREYLESGRKQGRGFDREELDERVIMRGDLAITDGIIGGMTGAGDKYLHITISFKEDEVDRPTLEAIVADFEEFAFSAYDGDEYDYYVEAHLPKIKSYTNERTGDFVERKPHIHLVIPKTNLLSGQYLSPFGRFEQNERFVAAFQEYANHKYGLASPQDNRRVELTSASEMLSRYKGDLFPATGRDLKERILSEVLEKKIDSYDEFKTMLAKHGEVRVRNEGKENEYLHVKPGDGQKGANLREYVFSRQFIELPDAAKRDRLGVEIQHRYEVAGPARKSPQALQEALTDWKERRALEIKYLNSGNRKAYQQYRQADAGQRKAMLAERAARFYEKHRQKEQDYGRTDASSRIERIRGNLRAASHHLEAAGRDIEKVGRTTGTATNIADRGNRRALAAAVERVAGSQIRTERVNLVTGRTVIRAADNVTAQFARDAKERANQERAGKLSEFQIIKRELDAKHLLNKLSHSHGVIPEKYEITKGKDGGDRIKCGSRNLNVADFMTKELSLSWKDAAQILRETYRQQTGREPQQLMRQQPRQQLWQDYQAWKKERTEDRQTAWTRQRESERARRVEIKRDFDKARTLNYAKYPAASRNRPTVEQRRAAMSLIRMARTGREMGLRENIEAERTALKSQYQKPYQEQYREFLTERAQGGDELALNELRRMRVKDEGRHAGDDARISADDAKPQKRADTLMRDNEVTYKVHNNGDVTYSRGGRNVLKDEGKSVRVLQTDDRTIETALRLAVQKFGGQMALSGSEEFQRRTAELVAEKGLRVTFSDERLNRIVAERQSSMAEEAKNLSRAREYLQRAASPQEALRPSVVPAKEAAPTIESQAANETNGRYAGKVVGVDRRYVYQQVGEQTVRHERKNFDDLPKLGDRLAVTYRQGRAAVKNLGLDNGLGL